LLKSLVEIAKDFRQSISMRLYKIQEIETVKESLSKFIDFPEEEKEGKNSLEDGISGSQASFTRSDWVYTAGSSGGVSNKAEAGSSQREGSDDMNVG
jgi:hypothetical protein